MAGFRFAVIYTKNPAVQTVLNDTVLYGSVPSIIQDVMATLLSDHSMLLISNHVMNRYINLFYPEIIPWLV